MNNETLFNAVPGVSALNKTPLFDPRKYLKMIVNKETGEVTYDIELKNKKLWFRTVYPTGRLIPTALQITDSIAVIECFVFFGKDDTEPAAGFIARTAKETHGAAFIQTAQYIAENEALSAAGFGCQFNDLREDVNAALVEVKNIPVATDTAPPVEKQEDVPEKNNAAEMEIVTAEKAVPAGQPADTAEVLPNESAEIIATETIHAEPDAAEIPATEIIPSRFAPDMTVEAILADMTREEAEAVVVDTGTCKGWTLAEVLERRPVSLKWYVIGYNGDNNILRAGAKLLLGESMEQIAT